MITRKVDYQDASPAAFAYVWIKRMAADLEQLKVISLEKGDISGLPKNVEIYSLGKEKDLEQWRKIGKIKKIIGFYKLAWRAIKGVDGVFCHQNPEYTILIYPIAKIFNKKIIAWYAHKHIGWKLRLVNLLADKIVTSSEKGCRLKNREKIKVIGQGIDVEYFKGDSGSKYKNKFKIISVGRISAVKNYQVLVEAINILANKKGMKNLEVEILGSPILEKDYDYLDYLKQLIKKNNLTGYIRIREAGLAHRRMLEVYAEADLLVNASQTGSMDKVVLEAMACEKLVLTCNEAFFNLLNDARFIFLKNDFQDLAEKIVKLVNLSFKERQTIGQQLRKKVVESHNLENLIKRILALYEKYEK